LGTQSHPIACGHLQKAAIFKKALDDPFAKPLTLWLIMR
jgi:hypothetical protein